MKNFNKKSVELYLKNWGQSFNISYQIKCKINSLETEFYNFDLSHNHSFISHYQMKQFYQEEIQKLINNLKDISIKYKFVDDIVNSLEKTQKNVIFMRYVKNYSWDYISIKNHLSRRTCFYIKDAVLKKIFNCL